MKQVHDFNLFPETEVLEILERKYGDSLSYIDLHGCKQKRRKRKLVRTDSMGPESVGTTGFTLTVGAQSVAETTQSQGRATPMV